MSLTQQVESALRALACPSVASQRIDETAAAQRFVCDLSAVDTLGCAFERFVLSADRLKNADVNELKTVAEELSKRLTYLLEPIQPIEIDSQQCVVQMRSVPPAKDDSRTSYYELLVRKPGELSLCRYTADFGRGRELALAQVTREVFVRLVRDFSAAAK